MGNVTLTADQVNKSEYFFRKKYFPLPYYFHWDVDFGMDLTHTIQTYYCIGAILTIHPLVLYLLIWESASLSKEIRLGYIATQVALILFEWIYGVFIKVYPLCPYPGLHCGGLLCGIGIHPQILLAILAFGVVIPDPPFLFLLLVMHQKLVYNTPSKVRFKKKTQFAMIVAVVVLLGVNVVGFGIFGRRTKKADEILSRPELAWLASKGGEVFLFGDIAQPESFAYECYLLAASIGLVMLFVRFFSYHTISVIKSTQNGFANETMRLQVRMISVLRYQFYGVFVCMAVPCLLVFLGIYFGTLNLPHPRYMAACRCMFCIIQIVDAVPLSLIFLLKNHTYRKVIHDKAISILHRLTPCIDRRTVVPVRIANSQFSSFPSSSITRPNGI